MLEWIEPVDLCPDSIDTDYLRRYVKHEVIAWENLPRNMASEDLQRLIAYWMGAALPHTTFLCDRFSVEE